MLKITLRYAFIWLVYFFQAYWCRGIGSGTAARIQTGLARIRIQTQHTQSKEKVHSPESLKDPFEAKPDPRRIKREDIGEKDVVVEFYCRSSKGSMWSFFKEVLLPNMVQTNSADYQATLLNGGITAEAARQGLDQQLHLICYGSGLGPSLFSQEVVQLNKEFRKVKPYHLQFGYKCPFEEKITILNRKSTALEKADKEGKAFPTIVPIDLNKEMEIVERSILKSNDIIAQIDNLGSRFGFMKDLVEKVDAFVLSGLLSSEREQNYDHVLITSDGSASFQQSTCFSSSVAVFLLPCSRSAQQPLTPPPSQGKEGKAPFPTSFQPSADILDYSYPALNKGLSVCVEGCASLTSSPFLAEVAASLSAHLLGGILLHRLAHHLQITPDEAGKRYRLTYLADSRALLRMCRAGRGESEEKQEGIEEGRTEEKETTTLSRLLHSLQYQQKLFDIVYDWTAGHPERVEENACLWSLYQNAIFIADETCRPSHAQQSKKAELKEQFTKEKGYTFGREYRLELREVLRGVSFVQTYL